MKVIGICKIDFSYLFNKCIVIDFYYHEIYYIEKEFHRKDGPALISLVDAFKLYFAYGLRYLDINSNIEWKKKFKELKRKEKLKVFI